MEKRHQGFRDQVRGGLRVLRDSAKRDREEKGERGEEGSVKAWPLELAYQLVLLWIGGEGGGRGQQRKRMRGGMSGKSATGMSGA